ncbi:hypothetical protein SAMN04488096_104221 [Mesonia phycicola]|uniref:Uncharacterized protein n=2 Tax=Mesonia phycicola TaxID=579105 RepID=A0A1M6DX39_9FLAO|nr:hypothetical protein SAMN04488096_104221 [Mesonia phycicola]
MLKLLFMYFKFFLFFIFIGFSSIAQEIENPNLFATNNQIIRADLYSGKAVSLSQFDGYIKPEQRHFSVPQGNVFGEENKGDINMMALAATEQWKQQSGIIDMQFPAKQLQQINGQVRVFYNAQENFKYRTNFNLNYYGQTTPDGGIRNEVYKDVSQPFINPYYGQRYNPYYNRRRSSNSSGANFNFYMTR